MSRSLYLPYRDEPCSGYRPDIPDKEGLILSSKLASRVSLSVAEVRESLADAFAQVDLATKRLLVIIPDSTRSGPTGLFFRLFHELLAGRVASLDFLIALGTHPPMSEEAMRALLGVSSEEMAGMYSDVRVFNHEWDRPGALISLGEIPSDEIEVLSQGRLIRSVEVTLNRIVLEYDQLLISGPVFPHEVAGFSGGNKYFFPGISGPDVIDFTHWLGALITSYEIIGTKYTPVRAVIDRAASMIPTPRLACCYVTDEAGLHGVFVGKPEEAWSRAADLSSRRHIRYLERPVRRVLCVMLERYDDIWTAAKGMYKLEPVVEEGGEVIIYAPHINEFSYTHGRVIEEIGYHVRDYFVEQWPRFKDIPLGVLAHSTHLRGSGKYRDGVETPRIQVTLATGISPERCERVNLGYLGPATIDLASWEGRKTEGLLLVPNAGEQLYRLKG